MMKTPDEQFEEKMKWLEGEIGIHPEMKFTMMVGPHDAKVIMDIMKAIYIAGVNDAKTGKVF